MTTMTASNLRKNLFDVFCRTAKYNDVVRVAGKEGAVVIMSEEDYRGMLETVYLYSQPGVVEEILSAKRESLEEGTVVEGNLV